MSLTAQVVLTSGGHWAASAGPAAGDHVLVPRVKAAGCEAGPSTDEEPS